MQWTIARLSTLTLSCCAWAHHVRAAVSVPGDPNDAVVRSDGSRLLTALSGRVGAGGGFFSPGGRAAVFAFRLPQLDTEGAPPIARASFNFAIVADQSDGTYGIDLYGLGARAQPSVLSGDYYAGPLDATDATLIHKGIIPSAHPNRGVEWMVSSSAVDPALTSYLNSQYADGHAGHYVFFRLNPDAAPAGEESGVDVAFAENSAYRPLLTLDIVPEPSLTSACAAAFCLTVVRRKCRGRCRADRPGRASRSDTGPRGGR